MKPFKSLAGTSVGLMAVGTPSVADATTVRPAPVDPAPVHPAPVNLAPVNLAPVNSAFIDLTESFDVDLVSSNRRPVGAKRTGALTRSEAQVGYRPFLVTGGRTESDLGYETLVWVTGKKFAWPNPRQARILTFAATPAAVAELAARADLPISVTRGIIGDLRAAGVLATEQPRRSFEDMPGSDDDDVAFVERIIAGLRAVQ